MLTFNLPLCLWQTLNVSGVLCRCWLNFSICLWQTLSHCELITDEGIRHIGSGACATEQLRILELDNCPLITDASLEHLTGCQNLERIELYDCQLITKAAIRRLRVRFVWIINHHQSYTSHHHFKVYLHQFIMRAIMVPRFFVFNIDINS